jgi:hypothetical protein
VKFDIGEYAFGVHGPPEPMLASPNRFLSKLGLCPAFATTAAAVPYLSALRRVRPGFITFR